MTNKPRARYEVQPLGRQVEVTHRLRTKHGAILELHIESPHILKQLIEKGYTILETYPPGAKFSGR